MLTSVFAVILKGSEDRGKSALCALSTSRGLDSWSVLCAKTPDERRRTKYAVKRKAIAERGIVCFAGEIENRTTGIASLGKSRRKVFRRDLEEDLPQLPLGKGSGKPGDLPILSSVQRIFSVVLRRLHSTDRAFEHFKGNGTSCIGMYPCFLHGVLWAERLRAAELL